MAEGAALGGIGVQLAFLDRPLDDGDVVARMPARR
jgi:hypothetical protein